MYIIASKYTDFPVFLLNSEHKFWQNFKNTEKLEDFVHTLVYGPFYKILKKHAEY